MTKAEWNGGYASDENYTYGFYPQQSPEHLNYACILNGVEPVPLDRPFTYFELGFGQGLTVTVLAASNPQGRFYANDFMPAHVAAAQDLAASAKLENVTFLEHSFAELNEGKVDLPQFDFITMHGVYAWISAENRQHIVNFIARYLKPGGVVYTGYNAMPGWAPMLPLQRLMLAHGRSFAGGNGAQLDAARKLAMSLAEADSIYFADNPDLQRRIKKLKTASPSYLAHEYLNDGWQPQYHADVASDFAAAKLSYVGSAVLCSAFDQLPANQQDVVDTLQEPAWRETVKDFFANTGFRQDVFVRGIRHLSARRKSELLKRRAIALTVSREKALNVFKNLVGREGEAARVFVDVIAQDPCTLDELAQTPLLEGRIEHVALLATLLVNANCASVFTSSAITKDCAPALRINSSLAQRSRFEDCYQALASPLACTGVNMGLEERLVYWQLVERPNDKDAHAIANYVLRYMREQHVDGTGVDAAAPTPNVANTVEKIEKILGTQVPLWRQLGMI